MDGKRCRAKWRKIQTESTTQPRNTRPTVTGVTFHLDGDGHHQSLRRQVATPHAFEQPLEHHTLMQRVLIDDQQTIVILHHQPLVVALHEPQFGPNAVNCRRLRSHGAFRHSWLCCSAILARWQNHRRQPSGAKERSGLRRQIWTGQGHWWNEISSVQCCSHRITHHHKDESLVTQTNLRLGRVDIHVNTSGINANEQRRNGVSGWLDESPKGLSHRLTNSSVNNRPPIETNNLVR